MYHFSSYILHFTVFLFYILHFLFYILHFTFYITGIDTDTWAQSCLKITDGFHGYLCNLKMLSQSVTIIDLRDASASKKVQLL